MTQLVGQDMFEGPVAINIDIHGVADVRTTASRAIVEIDVDDIVDACTWPFRIRDDLCAIGKLDIGRRKISVDELVEVHKAGQLNDAFGLGPAANIAVIHTVGVDGIDMELPPLEERTVSTKINKAISDLKYGVTEDTYGWIEEI